MEQGGTKEYNHNSENQNFEKSSHADRDEDSKRLIDEESGSQCNSNPNGTNTTHTVFLIVNASLASGLLNFPKSYDNAGGIVVAFFVQLALL